MTTFRRKAARIFSVVTRLGISVGAVALSVSVLFAGGASATGLGGTAVVADTSGNPLSGPQPSSSPNFELNLGTPPANSCSADSATGNTTFYSYMAPEFTDPGSETVSGAVSIGVGLDDTTGKVDGGNHNVAPSTAEVPVVNYSWAKTAIHIPGGLIPSGTSATYEVGILCWNSATLKVTDWWNTEVTFTGTSTQYTWSFVNGPPSSPPVTPESPLAVGLPLGGAAVLAGGIFILRRRSRPAAARI